MFGHFFISRSFNIILFLQGLARGAAIMANGGSLQGNNVFINQLTTCFVSLENSLTPLSQSKKKLFAGQALLSPAGWDAFHGDPVEGKLFTASFKFTQVQKVSTLLRGQT